MFTGIRAGRRGRKGPGRGWARQAAAGGASSARWPCRAGVWALTPTPCPPARLTPAAFSPSASTVGSFNRQCLSCDLVENCAYFSASFSRSMDFFLLNCEGASCACAGRTRPLGACGVGGGCACACARRGRGLFPGVPPTRGRRRREPGPCAAFGCAGDLHCTELCSRSARAQAVPAKPSVRLRSLCEGPWLPAGARVPHSGRRRPSVRAVNQFKFSIVSIFKN